MVTLILLSIVLLIISWISDVKRKYNPLIIFNGLWLFIYVLYLFNPLDIFIKLDLSTYIIFAIMQIGFTLGGLIGNKVRISIREKSRYTDSRTASDFLLREKLFIIITIIAIVSLFVDEVQIISKLINGVSFSRIMADAEGKGTVEYSGIFSVSLHMFFVLPMSYVVTPVCAVEVIYRKNKPMLYFILNLLVAALTVMHHGGRNALFQLLVCYVVVFLVAEKDIRMKLRTKVLAVIGIVVLFALINAISESRGISDIDTSFIGYFICSIPLSNEYLKTDIATYNMWGMYSLKGFFGPLFTVANYLGFPMPTNYLRASEFAGLIEDAYMSIGYNEPHRFNAFISAGTSMYLDGGYFIELIGMTIYGWLSGDLYRRVKTETTRNSRNLCLFAFFMIGVLFSFSRFWFTSFQYALAVFYFIILYHRDKEKTIVVRYSNEYSKSYRIVSPSVSSC